jgi:hypothetical protein
VAAAGCGSHGSSGAHNPLSDLSPRAQQRLFAQLDELTTAQVKRATRGRIDPGRYPRSELCFRKSDERAVCSVKGVGKFRFEWRWQVTVNPRAHTYRIRRASTRLPVNAHRK